MPVDYHAWTHRPKSLGGTDPIEFSSSQSVELSSPDGVGLAVAADTWEPMFNQSTFNRKATYVFDSDGGWNWNTLTGVVSRNEPAMYVAYASVDLDDVSNGDLIGVAVTFFGTGSGYFYKNVIPVTGGGSGARVSVIAQLATDLNGGFGRYSYPHVYAENGGTIVRGEFQVRQFELLSGGTEYFAGDLP